MKNRLSLRNAHNFDVAGKLTITFICVRDAKKRKSRRFEAVNKALPKAKTQISAQEHLILVPLTIIPYTF